MTENTNSMNTYYSNKEGAVLHLLDGQKLIADIALLHNIKESGFFFFRDLILTSLHLIHFLKPGEHLGFFIDSEEPSFQFKIEISSKGEFRTLLLPENFSEFPKMFTGKVRLAKFFPNNLPPYTSIIEIHHKPFSAVMDKILSQSFQTQGKVVLSTESDLSAMILVLPKTETDIVTIKPPTLSEVHERLTPLLDTIFINFNDKAFAHATLQSLDYILLRETFIKLTCTCSYKKMCENLSKINATDLDQIFSEHDGQVEVTCDYCHTIYTILKKELEVL